MDFEKHLLTFMNREEVSKLLESFNNEPVNAFKYNTKLINKAHIMDYFKGLKPISDIGNAFYFDKKLDQMGKYLEFYAGMYYIQEPSAMYASNLLDINSDDKVLDMCAAPGGKSFNVALKLSDNGLLVCNDLSNSRAQVLSSNIEKYGFTNVIVINNDSAKYKDNFPCFFNKIILDAPCSGSGMFRKNDETIKDWSIDKVNRCAIIQQSLLEDAYYMLANGGKIMYSTCSYSYEENEQVIINFLEKHPDMKIVIQNSPYSETINIKGGIRLYPFNHEGEGQVMFVLEKSNNEHYYKETRYIDSSTKIDKEVLEFLDYFNYPYDKKDIVKIKDNYYILKNNKVRLNNLNVLRYGVELGYMNNKRFIPSHALAHSLNMPLDKYLLLSRDQAIDYMMGLEIDIESNLENGYYIATYYNMPLGFVKKVNSKLKNHLPKGLKSFVI